MTRTKSKSRHTNRRTKRSGTKRSGTKRSGGGLTESKLAPELKPLQRDQINVYLDALTIKAPKPWNPPPPPHPSDVKELAQQHALMSTQSGHVKFFTDRLLAPASAAQDSPEQFLAQNSQKQQNDLIRSTLSNAHSSLTSLTYTSRLSKITDLKKQIFNLLFSKNPIDCGRQLNNLADVPFLIDVIVEKLKNVQTICRDMGPKCPLLSHYPDKYMDIFNALLKCRLITHPSDWHFISHLKSTEPEALRTRFRFSPERIEVLIHHFNGLKSVILTCIGGGSNPPLKSANPSLYNFLKKDAMNNPTLLHDLDKDEMREFKEYMRVHTFIRTMTISEVDAQLRTRYIMKIMNMIKDVYSGEEMEIRLIATLGASQPLPDNEDMDPDCDKLMAGLASLMPMIRETLSSRIANLGEVVPFW